MRRKLAVILAADVVGYTRLVADDEDETMRALMRSMSVFNQHITQYDGRVFNTAGDAVLAEFPSAINGVRCALDVQKALLTENATRTDTRKMHFRVGIALGDVVEQDGDLLGDGVNLAARLEGAAPPGGLCISRSVFDAVQNKVAVTFKDAGELQLKNLPQPIHAYTFDVLNPAPAPGAKAAKTAAVAPSFISPRVLIGAAAASAFVLVAGSVWLFQPTPKPDTRPDLKPPVMEKSAGASAAQPVTSTPVSAATPTTETAAATPVSPPASSATSAGPATTIGGVIPLTEATRPNTPPADTAPATDNEASAKLQACRRAPPERLIQDCTVAARATGLDKPALGDVNVRLGKALRAADRAAEALAAFSRAIDLDPTPAAYVGRGILRYDAKAYDQAIDDFSAALRLAPKDSEALNNRAWTRYKKGDYTAALADADAAVAAEPDAAFAWDTRGHIFEALKQRDNAIRDYRRALALNPTLAASREGLARLHAQP